MAFGWLAVALKTVSLADVVSTAPVVVDGARKLWGAIHRKRRDDGADLDGAATPAPTPGEPPWVRLEQRQAALEAKVAEQHDELLSSSDLLKDLAEQNARLVKVVDALRIKARVLFGLAIVSLVGVVAIAVWLGTRG